MSQNLQNLVRSVAEDEISRLQPMMFGQRVFEIKTPAVGVTVQFPDGVVHGFHRLGRWPQGVFVRGHLDGIGDAEFAFEFFHRLSRLVDDDVRNGRALLYFIPLLMSQRRNTL